MSNRPLPPEPKHLPPFRIGDDKGGLPQRIARPHQGMIITGPLHPFADVVQGFSFSFQTSPLTESGRHSEERGSCIVYLDGTSPYCSDKLDPFAGVRFCRTLVYTSPTQPRGTRQQYECYALPLRLVREVTQGVLGADSPNILTQNQGIAMVERILELQSGGEPSREYANLNPVAQADEKYFKQLDPTLLKELSDLLRIGKIPARIRSLRNRRQPKQE